MGNKHLRVALRIAASTYQDACQQSQPTPPVTLTSFALVSLCILVQYFCLRLVTNNYTEAFPTFWLNKMQLLCLFFIEILSIPGLRRTSQQVTHCRGTKKEVAVLVGSTIRRTLGLIRFGIAMIIKLLSARHSCKLDLPFCQRTMNQQSASSIITESTCLRSYRRLNVRRRNG